MQEAITFGHVLGFIGIVGGFFAVVAVLFGVLWLINPFRSGH